MEKKYILVGMENRRLAFDFMNDIISSLGRRSIRVPHIDMVKLRFETENTEVRFVCSGDPGEYLAGVRADALFGVVYPHMLYRAKPDAVMAARDRIGLVDYICEVERSRGISDAAKKAFRSVVESYCLVHKIRVLFHVDYHNDTEHKFIIQHEYRSDTAIHVIWSEVEDIDDCLEAVLVELKKWTDPKQIYITTANPYCNDAWMSFRDSMRGGYTYANPKIPEKRVCDTYIGDMYPKTMIMAGRQNGKSLYRHVLNAVYGKSPNYMTQLEIYAALMKGENNMGTNTTPNPEFVKYCRNDVDAAARMVAACREIMDRYTRKRMFAIKKVYFNDPVTVVIWEDGSKTVVRCNNDQYDPEKGLAMAIAKKALGTNKSGSNYYDAFKKWLPKTEEEPVEEVEEKAEEPMVLEEREG